MSECSEPEDEALATEQTAMARTFQPDVDVYETDSSIVIRADMPGASEGDVDVHVEDDVLSLVGRISMDDHRDLTPVYTEHRVGNFERSFSISTEIDSEGIIGRMSDGVLEIGLPKRAKVRPRQIEIKSG